MSKDNPPPLRSYNLEYRIHDILISNLYIPLVQIDERIISRREKVKNMKLLTCNILINLY